MIQGGGFDKDLNERKYDAPIKNEAGNGLKNEAGTLAMARTNEVDSATAQFLSMSLTMAFSITATKGQVDLAMLYLEK